MKKATILMIISILALVSIGLLYVFVYENPLRGTLYGKGYEPMMEIDDTITYNQAKEDFDYLYNLIKTRHYSALGGNVQENVTKAYDTVINELKSENSLSDMWRGINSILHELDDGHAQTGYLFQSDPKIYNVSFDVVSENECYVTIDGQSYKLVSIYGLPISSVYNIAKETFSYENIYYLNHLLEKRLVYPIYETYFTNNVNEIGTIQYLDSNNQIVTYHMQKVQISNEDIKAVTYSIDLNNNIGLLKINQMIDDEASKKAFHDFFSEVKKNNIDNIIIDLQDNGGGNSLIIKNLMTYFPMETYKDYGSSVRYRLYHTTHKPQLRKNDFDEELSFSGKIFLITSSETFSSAAMLTAIFKDNDMGLIYGEPIGNKPSMYGDILQYQLPNSKFPIQLTYKFFTRPNGVTTDKTIMPDVLVNPSEAYLKIVEDIS